MVKAMHLTLFEIRAVKIAPHYTMHMYRQEHLYTLYEKGCHVYYRARPPASVF